MRAKDLVVGEFYRHKDNPTYCWAKVINILAPNTVENNLSKIIVKCEWSTDKDSVVGLIKYFKPSDLVKG